MLAPRNPSLTGLSVGLIDNRKPWAAIILRMFAERLRADFQLKKALHIQKSSGIHLDDSAAQRLATEAHFVLAALGDCNLCASGTLLDALTMEKRGLPAAALICEPYVDSAREMAQAQGLPDYAFLILPQPSPHTSPDEVASWVQERYPLLVELLTVPRTRSDR